jgi:predicted CopG family antitoxin
MNMKTITICSSANFYEEVVRIKHELESKGFTVLIPATARKMEASGDYDVAAYKTWYGNADDYHKKTSLMRGHFDEIAKADAVLVVNNEKNGVPNYIGGNVLMEMAVAFHLHLPLFLLNDVPTESVFLEEIIGLQATPLQGDLQMLTAD